MKEIINAIFKTEISFLKTQKKQQNKYQIIES